VVTAPQGKIEAHRLEGRQGGSQSWIVEANRHLEGQEEAETAGKESRITAAGGQVGREGVDGSTGGTSVKEETRGIPTVKERVRARVLGGMCLELTIHSVPPKAMSLSPTVAM
jgi:hypothetical protein